MTNDAVAGLIAFMFSMQYFFTYAADAWDWSDNTLNLICGFFYLSLTLIVFAVRKGR